MGMAERMMTAVAQLSFQNVAIIALLVLVALPSYFVWVVLHDKELRHDMMSSLQVIDAGVPCLVYIGQQAGQSERYTVGSGYASEGRFDRLIAVRASGLLTQEEIKEACGIARGDAETMRKALATGTK